MTEEVSQIRTLTWSEDGHFYAALPDFPGCIGDGPTLPEAVEDCRKAALECPIVYLTKTS